MSLSVDDDYMLVEMDISQPIYDVKHVLSYLLSTNSITESTPVTLKGVKVMSDDTAN